MVEMLSNRYIDSPAGIRLEERHEAATLRVLDQWPGTPESLGEALETATSNVDSWLQGNARHIRLAEKATARRLIRQYEGGQQLLDLEWRINNL